MGDMIATSEQQAAITSEARNILCVSGPGAGKTTVVIERIKRLIADGVDPKGIIAITYCNAAAKVLAERLGDIQLGGCSTLHGFCLRYLQLFREFKNVAVLDEFEADAELLRCAEAAGVKATFKELRTARRNRTTEGAIGIAIRSYSRQMAASRTLDFDSVLTKALEMMQTYDTGLLISHLFVDELSDSAAIDFEIYKTLDVPNRFYCGDSDQCIFGFRNGYDSARQFVALAADPAWTVLKLEQNFRCAPEICEAAQRLIEHNPNRIDKRTFSVLTDAPSEGVHKAFLRFPHTQPAVDTFEAFSCIHEAVSIAAGIQSAVKQGGEAYGNFAVLARTNAIVELISETLAGHNIPIRKRKPLELPEDWRVARAALRMLQAGTDESIIGLLRAKQSESTEHYRQQAALGKINLRETLTPGLERTIEAVARDLTRLDVSRESIDRIMALRDELVEPTMSELIMLAAETRETEEVGDGVTVTTVHGFKGREAEIVIVAGCENETFPSRRADIEEERRVFFVAVTRAKRRLLLTWAKHRKTQWGAKSDCSPSVFLREMGAIP